MKKTVVIVDDHLLIAKAIASVIDDFNGFEVLYEAENGSKLGQLFKVKKNIPDIILLDISMPVMNGFETARWLTDHFPSIKIMALTMQGDNESLIKMVKAGAKGYLQKNVHPVELQKGLESLTEKGYYYPDWATSTLLHSISKDNSAVEESIHLTERETEFLGYACSELTYKEIGEKMFCSPRTVESYRDSLFTKLEVKTRVALALYAVKIGIFRP